MSVCARGAQIVAHTFGATEGAFQFSCIVDISATGNHPQGGTVAHW